MFFQGFAVCMFSTSKRARGLLNVVLFLFLSPFSECLPVSIRCFSVCTLSRVSQSVLCLSVFLFGSSSFLVLFFSCECDFVPPLSKGTNIFVCVVSNRAG
uniref:Secreted protein n=1 Tax=Ixodes scapularis TaxID=6945 RepID=A0A4D5RCI5_IXOSC